MKFIYDISLTGLQTFHAGMNYAVKIYKEESMTVNQICKITSVSRASLYRKLSEGNN